MTLHIKPSVKLLFYLIVEMNATFVLSELENKKNIFLSTEIKPKTIALTVKIPSKETKSPTWTQLVVRICVQYIVVSIFIYI